MKKTSYGATAARPGGAVWRRLARGFLGVALAVIAATGCSDRAFRQNGSSAMAPTIQPNESVVAEMGAYRSGKPQRWDVVVFHPPTEETGTKQGEVWVMRVAGLPGESLDIRGDGIYADGRRQAQPGRIDGIRYFPGIQGAMVRGVSYPCKIPEGSYFLLGDNTTNSFDSRFWGPVSGQRILGRVRNK
ncbi:MAG: signal peptidase I [Verrucomicrobia bacterium]|nr:signal peptidase I [Verrucomicrobiota bacterium]